MFEKFFASASSAPVILLFAVVSLCDTSICGSEGVIITRADGADGRGSLVDP